MDDKEQFIIESLMTGAQGAAIEYEDDPLALDRLLRYTHFLLSRNHSTVYKDLTDFLEWYGVRDTLPRIMELLNSIDLFFSKHRTVVELGPGTGWLIGALADYFSVAYAIEKRIELYTPRKHVHLMEKDLEVDPLDWIIAPEDPPRLLVVANHFLHCLDDPGKVIHSFRPYTWLVIEPYTDMRLPYWSEQMKLFGAKPINDDELLTLFSMNGLHRTHIKEIPGQFISIFERS